MNTGINGSGPTKYVCFKLGKVMRKVQRYYESSLASYAITPVQFYVLNALWENDPIGGDFDGTYR